ncbi:MAG: SUMF1/EgtB/PvdO family nonheme iron enzyme [Spirochaetaceae bacterium]|nr:SUMF1/EgtB/PvdO family nonheme iron enzyme [Spirochaetaceae bacterium]
MKSKKIIVFSVLVILGILFGITSCKNFLLDTKKTTININLDLSKLIKTSRNQTSQEATEYILKIFAYDAANYQDNAEIEKLPLITQTSNKVDTSGIVKTSLEVPIDSNIIFEAQLFREEDSNPLYAGRSEIITIKPQDNKVHLELTKTQTNVDIGITIENEQIFIIQFNSLGGSYVETQKVEKGKTVTEPTTPEKEGYNFGYWYTSKDNGATEDSSYNFSVPVTSDITLYAKWITKSDIIYKVEHYQQNIEDDEYSFVEVDTESKTGIIGTETQAVAKNYVGFSVNTFEQKTILADGSTTVKIYYTRNINTVTFNANGGSYVETQIVKYEENATLPTKPTKDGYVFEGWYTSFDNGITLDTKFDFTSSITNDVILFAKWKLAERFVFVQGASINGAITAEGYIESEIFKEGGIVSIPNFYISDHEVTQAEYKAIMGTWPDKSVEDVQQVGIGDNYPAHHVNWFDTLVYCNKRSINEGLTPCYTINESTNPDEWGDVPDSENHENFETWFNATCDFQANGYRLPTSAEWEYAARGGNGLTGFQYKYAGSNSIDMVAWCSENSSGTSHEVKLKQPNELGLYDMSGNLWEFCWNLDLESSEVHLYGYNWYDSSTDYNISESLNLSPSWRGGSFGFRLVQTATEQSQGDVYSQGISLNGKIYDKTSEVVVVPKGTVAKIEMEDDSSWNTYLEDDADLWYKGVFLKGRKVKLSPFAMSQFEVTQELYEVVMGENPSTYINNQTTDELVKLRPVDSVKWYDAVIFCNELTKCIMGEEHCVYTVSDVVMDETNSYITNANVVIDLSKKGYRFPTEAEWEFAARGGNPASDVWKYAYAGVPANSNEINKYFWNDTDTTHEVGRKNSNSLGLYDMSSNMYEWTCDGYKQQVTITDEFIENPVVIPDESDKRFVARGGNFASEPYSRYVSYRHATISEKTICGFRLVRTITE